MRIKQRVLVYPCGTEIALEIYRAVCMSTHYALVGGSSNYDHGRFVYQEHIDGLPFITDKSSADEIAEFNQAIAEYNIDFIYPAMDGVLTVFSKYSDYLDAVVVAPDYETTKVTRSKKATYELLKDIIAVPTVYGSIHEIQQYPIFIKPDVGQGAKGAKLIRNKENLDRENLNGMLMLEYLPGDEFTVDCFTNAAGKLVYSRGRGRKRIKDGISVNAVFEDDSAFSKIAAKINSVLNQRGGWFFQVKRDVSGSYKLLEVASRIAGTSALTRVIGVNLPLLTLETYAGINIDSVLVNTYSVELDRALSNTFRCDIQFDRVYIDYDDTVMMDEKINCQMVHFLYNCINNNREIILLSKHESDLNSDLKRFRLSEIFDKVIHISPDKEKIDYIEPRNSIFVDDSYGERKAVFERYHIPVFDTHMIEMLLEV